MKFGMNLMLWTTNVTEDHVPVLEELKKMGFDGVEFPIFNFDKALNKTLRKHLDRIGLKCTGCTVLDPSMDPLSADAAARKAGLDHLKKSIDTCEILGAEVLCGPLAFGLGSFTGQPRTDAEWKRAQDVMKKAAAYAEKKNITLALEPLNRFETYFLNTAADGKQFVEEVGSPRLGIMWDTFHANIEEENIAKALEAVVDKVVHVHISENNRSIPGTGHIKFSDTFNVLKKSNYQGWVTIEAFSAALKEIAGAAKIWRKMFEDNAQLADKGLKMMKKLAA